MAITSTQDEICQPTDLDVEEADVVIRSTVGVDYLDFIGPRVLAQAEKFGSMPHEVRGFKY